MGIFTKKHAKPSSKSLSEQMLKSIVDISLKSVDGALTGGILSKSSENLHTLSHTSASASEEMGATALSIANSAADAAHHVHNATDCANTAVSEMNSIRSDMTLAEERIRALEAASSEIEQVVAAIDEIAEQTNLLALNAAIEAARAGDAGRGFAVVAEEVKKLSTRSQEATGEIVKTIAQVQKNIEEAAKAVLASSLKVESGTLKVGATLDAMMQVNTSMEHIAEATKEQQIATTQISESVHDIVKEAENNTSVAKSIWGIFDSLVEQVEVQRASLAEEDIPHKILHLAKADHALWKKKIMDFEAGRIQLKANEMADHTLCRLGKWYYSQEGQRIKSHKEFSAIEAPHKKVHDAAKEIVAQRSANKRADVSALIRSLGEASAEVIRHLDALIEYQEKKNGANSRKI